MAASGCIQVSLSTSALNEQGNAARVSAKDSNRTTLRKGVATFKNVRIQAQSDGVYKLTIGAVSRKHVVQEAMITAKVGGASKALFVKTNALMDTPSHA